MVALLQASSARGSKDCWRKPTEPRPRTGRIFNRVRVYPTGQTACVDTVENSTNDDEIAGCIRNTLVGRSDSGPEVCTDYLLKFYRTGERPPFPDDF
jgi:hypothetical protein